MPEFELAVGALGALLALTSSLSLAKRRPDGTITVAVVTAMGYGVVSNSNVGPHTVVLLAVAAVILWAALWSVRTSLQTRASGGPIHTVPGASIVLVLLAVYLACVNVLLALQVTTTQAMGRLLPAVAFLGLAIALARTRFGLRELSDVVGLVFGMACFATIFVFSPWLPCSAFKCTTFGQLFTGAFPNENILARLAALALLLVIGARSKGRLALTAALAFLVLFGSVSRTSVIALVLGVAARLVAPRIWARVEGARLGIALALPASVLAIGLGLVYTADLDQYSNRGTIWRFGREAVEGHEFFGSGIDNWTIDVLARNYMHSEVLLLLYSGGAVAVILYWIALSLAIRAIPVTQKSGTTWSLLTFILVVGLGEIVLNPAAIDGTAPFLVAFLVAVSSPDDAFKVAARRDREARPVWQHAVRTS